MPRNLRSLVVIFCLLRAAPGTAQSPPITPPPGRILNQVMHNHWLHFSIVSGRIVVDELAMNNINQTSSTESESERISVSTAEGQPTIDYQQIAVESQFMLAIKGDSMVIIRRTPRSEQAGGQKIVPVEYLQSSPGEPITFSVGATDHRQTYRAASIWHLALAEKEVVHKYLSPLLEILRSDGPIEDETAKIEEELLHLAATGRIPNRQQWATWIAQLDDDHFFQRQAADRALREEGVALLPYLQQLDLARLSSEQQFRIRQITSAMVRDSDEDTPDMVAAWLQTDPRVWFSLLSRPSQSTRTAALAQLTKLVTQPIDFDPAASAVVRKNQIEKLRGSLSFH